jgi:O-antigen/teichoic acid export membrane protein
MSDRTRTKPLTPLEYSLSGRGLLSSASWMTGSHLIAQSFAYLSLILLARWLPPASFGTVAVGTAIVYAAALVVDGGTIGAVIVSPRLDRADLTRAFRRCMLRALVLTVMMAAAASAVVDKFANGGDATAVAVLALCLPLEAVSVVPRALLQKSMQFRRIAGLTATANVLSAISAIGMGMAGYGVWALVARQLVLFAVIAAMTSALCLTALRSGHLVLQTTPAKVRSPSVERWFFLFGISLMVTANLDNFVVGASGNASLVGWYALAFTIAMAPTTHLADPVGKVLFAAAASRPEGSAERVEQSVRLMAMLLVPMLPVGILAAPAVLPTVLGSVWEPIVAPFQVLLVVGVGYAIVNCIGEALSGNGHIAFRANIMIARCAATLLALVILVPTNGIRGAALAQLLVFVPFAAIYASAGARRAGTSTMAIGRALRPAAIAVSLQVIAAGAVLLAFGTSEAAALVAAAVAALAGVVAYALALLCISRRTRPS